MFYHFKAYPRRQNAELFWKCKKDVDTKLLYEKRTKKQQMTSILVIMFSVTFRLVPLSFLTSEIDVDHCFVHFKKGGKFLSVHGNNIKSMVFRSLYLPQKHIQALGSATSPGSKKLRGKSSGLQKWVKVEAENSSEDGKDTPCHDCCYTLCLYSVQPAPAFVTGSFRKYLQSYNDLSQKVCVQNIGPMNNLIKVSIFINRYK